MPTTPKPDWDALRVEYIAGTLSLADLSAKHGAPLATCEKRCKREGWAAERERLSAKVRTAAVSAVTKTRSAELREWNDSDLRVAKALRARVAARLSAVDTDSRFFPSELRTLAAAAESAQRIARLALGATTTNTGISDPDGKPSNPPTLGDFYDSLAAFRAALSATDPSDREQSQ